MKVLHINCNYMGTSLHQHMVEHLDLLSENVVFCPVYEGSKLITKPNKNVIVSKCFNSFDRFFFYKKQKKVFNALDKSCTIDDFDLVHAYTLFTDGNVALSIKRKFGTPYVVAVRSTDLYFFRKRINLRRRGIEILENASMIFFLASPAKHALFSNYVPKELVAILGNKSRIIPNGIDDFWIENRYSEKNIEETVNRLENRDIRILCVGQIIKRKNIPTVQEALKLLRNEGYRVHLDVVGKKYDDAEYKKIAIDPCTTIHSPVPKEQLIDFYRKNDIFVLASYAETFGLVYAEAMSQGLPVVYSKGQGFDGQFPDGEVGYAVEAEKPEDICRAIKMIVNNYYKIAKTITVRTDKFIWKDICDTYMNCYNSLI